MLLLLQGNCKTQEQHEGGCRAIGGKSAGIAL